MGPIVSGLSKKNGQPGAALQPMLGPQEPFSHPPQDTKCILGMRTEIIEPFPRL